MSPANRWLVGVAVLVAVLVAGSVAVSLLLDLEADLDRGTPEGTVQAYLRAVAGRDSTAALAMYDDDLRARCDATHVRDAFRFGRDDFRATLSEVVQRDDLTEVRVNVAQRYGGDPFSRSESTFEQVFLLREVEGEWRFVEPPWPTYCPQMAPPAPAATASAQP